VTLTLRALAFYRRHLPKGYWFVTLLAAFLRLYNLGFPKTLVFDETYYVKDSWTLWKNGFESNWPSNPNAAFESGRVNGYFHTGSFVVHPPLGKWLIAIPMALFGPQHSWTWRLTVALIGIAAVFLLMRVAKRLTGSNSVAVLAGFLMAIDGHAIVLSRIALLDGILMFFALLAFYFLLRDRDATRVRYQLMALREAGVRFGRASALPSEPASTKPQGSYLWRRPWLVACALALGAATSVKWSGLYFAAFFGLYVVVSETLLRRRLGMRSWFFDGFGQALVNLVLMVPAYAAVYLASWTGWIVTSGGWGRNAAGTWWQSLLSYHQQIYNFHVNLHTPHPYASNPFTWLFMTRPVAFYYSGSSCPSLPYGCSSAISAIANPLIWWGATAALFYLTILYFRDFNRTHGLVLLGVAAGYLPWLLYTQRTVFEFYAIAFEPWMILALAITLRALWYRKAGTLWRRYIRFYLLWVCIISVFFLSEWWGFVTPYIFWILHMWLGPLWI
jgi:dolichyl-phosphate-mannose-protein mannosyltransferase